MFEIGEAPSPLTLSERQSRFRKTPKGKTASQRERKARSERDYLTKPFIFWDGEGVTRVEGEKQDYVLFGNSLGDRLRTPHGYLSTAEIFRFIFSRVQPKTINVIYGASYDWNMWMRDIPRETLQTLYDTGQCEWSGYWIKMRPGKQFHIGIRGTKETALFYDVVSLFQRPFIAACDEYLGDGFEDRDLIVKNKRLRSGFDVSDLEEIERYMSAELVNGVKLMNEFRERIYRVGMRVSRWDGPGALAVALFQEHDIKSHLSPTERWMSEAVTSAYFGGRFEVCLTGYSSENVYEYDINSAYPWALQDVPSLAGGRWVTHTGYHDPGTDFVLHYVVFTGHINNVNRPYPLPFRKQDGNVSFPRHVVGWYWGPEVAVAQKYVDQYGGSLAVQETRVFYPVTDVRPFAFIGPIYKLRLALKKAKDGAQVGIKLALNSMYGKLAQQLGWKQTPNGIRIPPYHQLEYAGYATSRCRAALFDAVLQDLDSVVAFETDAMFTTRPLTVIEGEGLGEWGRDVFTDMVYLQSGTYFAHSEEDGELVEKTRGVDRGELTFAHAYRTLEHGGTHIPAKMTRFHALGTALTQSFDKWLVWEKMSKMVSVFPGAKRTHYHEMCTQCGAGHGMVDTFHETWPDASIEPGSVSMPHQLEWETVTETGRELARLRRENHERRGILD